MDNQELKDITVSIIVPIYNTRAFLATSLDSIKEAISGIEAEVICVDDGSTDGSGEIADKYAQDNPEFLSYHIDHAGTSAAREFGISKAQGKYLSFVDSDDYISKTFYKDMLYICEKNNLNLCTCNITRFKDNRAAMISYQYQLAFSGEPRLITTLRDSESLLYDGSCCNKLIRRDFWIENGISFPDDNTYEDLPVAARLFSKVGKFGLLHSFGYFWRFRSSENSRSQNAGSLKAMDDRMRSSAHILALLKRKYGEDSSLSMAMERRMVCWEFDVFLLNLYNLSLAQTEVFLNKIRDFFQKNVREESLKSASLFNRKKYEYIINGETEKLLRLLNHKRLAWRSAPIEKIGEDYLLKLPEDIYETPYALASRELQDDLPLTRLTHLEQNQNELSLDMIVYQPRVNVSRPDSRTIKPYLYNEHTGKRFDLDCEPIRVNYWTINEGTVVSYDDYKVYHYDYDWAGIRITVDFNRVINEDEETREILTSNVGVKPRWLLCLEYDTPVLSGHRIVRGSLPDVRNEIKSINLLLESQDEKLRINVKEDIRQTLIFEADCI